MLAIYYNYGTPVVLRPTPFISITQNAIRNKSGMLGSYYDIVLNGTILPDEGSPFYITGGGASNHSQPDDPVSAMIGSYARPPAESVHIDNAMSSIIHKQNIIRELFKRDGQKIELLPVSVAPLSDSSMTDTPVLKFFPTVQSISFEEGIYLTNCKYTINLRAEVLLDNNNRIISDGLPNSTFTPPLNTKTPTRANSGSRLDFNTAINASGFIEDYSESWSIEVEEGNGTTNTNTPNPTDLRADHISSVRTYRLTRSITATGRTMYYPSNNTIERREAWEQAKQYIYSNIIKDTNTVSTDNSTGYEDFPEYSLGPYFGSGFLNIAKSVWGGYNHLRTESIDVTAGTVTVNDTWLLSSGNAYENYTLSISKSDDSPIFKVSIDGTIKGLSSVHAGSTQYGGSNTSTATQFGTAPLNTAHENARYKWNQISNTGTYGRNCYLYRRAQAVTHETLNWIPLSVSLSSNEFTGEIGYNVEYDTRTAPLVSGTLSENISCTDTYPGDSFAIIPVIGRQTGPVLQYIGGRTEYQRSLNIDLVMDKYWDGGNSQNQWQRIRTYAVTSKPSLNEPYKSAINSIIHAYSPVQELGIRKYFVNPPVESWDPISGRYTLQINWIYEVNR